MAIETPIIFTGVHEEEIVQNNVDLQSFTEEFYRKVGQNNNWLIDLRPVGTIIFVNINQEGGGQPDPTIWQECNGSEITNPNSPLRTIGVLQNFVPDLRDRYLRSHSSDVGNPMGGSQDHNLAHSHSTGGPSSVGPGLQDKGDRNYRVPHTHAVATQYSNPTTFTAPAYVYMIAYMKVI